jgi:transcriptional regulator with XRE-family HTH domain
MDWKARLKAKREAAGWNNKTLFADAVGVSPATVTDWEKSVETGGIGKIKGENLVKVCSLLGIDERWLLEGGESDRNVIPMDSARSARKTSNEIEIPQFHGVGGSMGNGLILRDLPGEIQGWRVTPEWLTKNVRSHTGIANLCIVTGFGPSMKPMFNPGDPLLMDRGVKTVEFDGIYFFRVGDEGFIKMLQRVPGEGLRVVSKNKDYETWTVKADMDFEVFGLIIKVWCGTDS